MSDEATLRNAFRVFDEDGSGYLDQDEFRNAMQSKGDFPLSDEDADALMSWADTDGDGRISVDEFLHAMLRDNVLAADAAAAVRRGRFYDDEEFPPSSSSLGREAIDEGGRATEDVKWLRPSSFAPEATLFQGGVGAEDIIQGSLGDCWFLGGLSVVATRPDLLRRVVGGSDSYHDKGVYSFRLCSFGEWEEVVIDDQIPCSNAGPCFATSKDPKELWVMLLEKAYAKYHQTYSALIGGWVTDALVDLTGGVPSTIMFEDKQEDINSGEFWNTLKEYFDSGEVLMGCAKSTSGQREQDEAGLGILAGHAYGILRVVECQGVKLIRCRNPWGCSEWTGRWSDKDGSWTSSMRRELDFVDSDDGAFWIEYDDFVAQYNKIYTCHVLGASWYRTKFKSAWEGELAGGCVNHDTWTNNPMYKITIYDECQAVIAVQKRDPRTGRGHEDYYVGMALFRSSDGEKVTRYSPYKKTQINNQRCNIIEVTLEPGTYVAMPFTFEPDQEMEFLFSVYTKAPATVESLDGGEPLADSDPPPVDMPEPEPRGGEDNGDDDVDEPAGPQVIHNIPRDDSGEVSDITKQIMAMFDGVRSGPYAAQMQQAFGSYGGLAADAAQDAWKDEGVRGGVHSVTRAVGLEDTAVDSMVDSGLKAVGGFFKSPW